MKSIKYILAGVAALLAVSSCSLERQPFGSMSSDLIAQDPEGQLPTVMNGIYAQMKGWADVMHRCGEYAGDNIMIRGTSTDSFYEFISYSRTPNNGRLQTFWDNSYKVIAQSSNVINMVDEDNSDLVKQYLGEAYFLRGMMYFYLCRAYGRPYYDNADTNMGVPIVNGTPKDVVNVVLPDRASVKEVYAQSIADLEKASQLMNEARGVGYASKAAADALLSRIYLFMSGTWANPNIEYAAKAQQYAEAVINSGDYALLPYEQFKQYNTYTPNNNKESIFVVNRVATEFSGYDHFYGVGGMYAVIGGMGWGEMYASAKYLALLDETGRNDWYNNKIVDARAGFIAPRYKADKDSLVFRTILPIKSGGAVTSYAYRQYTLLESNTIKVDSETISLVPIDAGQGSYSANIDGVDYKGYIDQFIMENQGHPMFYITKCSLEGEDSHLHSPVITRLGEVYLNLAEAQAKQGSYGDALTNLNIVRERSLPGEGYATLDASNYIELIEKERQLELAFQAERSYDVYRNGLSLERQYPGPHNAMEVIQPNDYRTVYFIPQNAINAYRPNILTQNPTS